MGNGRERVRKTIRIKQRARRKRREEGDREEEEGWKRTRQMKGRRKRRKRGSVGRSVGQCEWSSNDRNRRSRCIAREICDAILSMLVILLIATTSTTAAADATAAAADAALVSIARDDCPAEINVYLLLPYYVMLK